jgi:hypothetical protein
VNQWDRLRALYLWPALLTVSDRTEMAATLMVAMILKTRPFLASPRKLPRLARIRT